MEAIDKAFSPHY